MRDGVLHCIVVDPVAVSPFDTLCSMFCQPVDSGGWWKWWFRGSWVGWVFAFDGYTELPEAGSDPTDRSVGKHNNGGQPPSQGLGRTPDVSHF